MKESRLEGSAIPEVLRDQNGSLPCSLADSTRPPQRKFLRRLQQGAGESALIRGIAERFAGVRDRHGAVSLGIGDDCAVLRPPRGWEVLVTTDFLLEGRHFRRDTHPADAAGHRCLARGLSDLAAMGGRPMAAFLSLALPRAMLRERSGRVWVERFLDGMRRLAERCEVPLAGGDTAEAPDGTGVVADIVLVGTAPRGKALRRSGARAGDRLFCTGALGGAAAELAGMLTRPKGTQPRDARLRAGWEARVEAGKHPQMFPEPRLRVGEALRRRGLATAAIDVSDGISTDLAHLCRASGVRAEVWEAALPVHALASGLPEEGRLRAVLHGGEDYELLFAARPGVRVPRRLAGVPVTEIGLLVEGKGVGLVEEEGVRELEVGGWEHFGGSNTAKATAKTDATTAKVAQRDTT